MPETRLLVVMAKEPVAGQVKTRMFPHLSAEEAATMYKCFLEDTLSEMSRLDGLGRAVAYTPEGSRRSFEAMADKDFRLFPQRGNNLGERLLNVFVDKLGEGYGAVSIIDSDSPDLPCSVVRESFRVLLEDEADVVFGPCRDGGYYLVGSKKPYPGLFGEIPWSTSRVLSMSLRRARDLRIRAALLAPWDDIDNFGDLVEFAKRRSRRGGKGGSARKTLRYISELGILPT